MKQKPVHIYGLLDPDTLDLRYIGKTNQSLNTRLSAHLSDKSSCHRVNWLNQLKKQDKKPEIILLETIQGKWPWQESERFWIRYYLNKGCKLTNNTSGGDGVPDLPKETREKMRQTWLGRKHKPETLEKLKEFKTGTKLSPETKAKISKAHKGREITWGDKLSRAVSKFTKEQTEVIQGRLNNGELVKDLANEYGVHRTTISKIKKGTYFNQAVRNLQEAEDWKETGTLFDVEQYA